MYKRIKYILTILIFIITTFTLISCGSSKTPSISPDNPSDIDDGDSTDGEPASDTSINASDYIEGLTFIYNTQPKGEDALNIKNTYLSKIEEILTNISLYTDLIFNELNYKQVLLQYLIDAYNLNQINNIYELDINEIDGYINSYISYVDHYGLLPTEEDILNDVILDLICELKKDDVITYLENNPTFMEDYPNIINPTIIDIDETLYINNDGVPGFGSEVYMGEIDNTTNIIPNLDLTKLIDLNGNGAFDLWNQDTFIGIGTYSEGSTDNYYYALTKQNDEIHLEFNEQLIIDELHVNSIPSYWIIDGAGNETYYEAVNDIILYVFCSDDGEYKYENINTTEKNVKYYDISGNAYYVLGFDENLGQVDYDIKYKYEIVGAIKNNIYYPASNYLFDISLAGFQNYRNVVKICIERTSNNWDIIPFINIEQLSLEDFNNNTSLEITNLTSVILDIKEEIKIKNIKLLVDSNDIINANGYCYNKENYNYFDLGSFNTSEVLLDFSNKNITLDKHKTSTDISDYIIDDNHNIRYSDETSTYLMLSFKTNSIINISNIELELTK